MLQNKLNKNPSEDTGIYYEGVNTFLVITPKKTKTFKSLRVARILFNKWMNK